MKTTDNKINVVLERNCSNCNYFFPFLLHGPSEYGICLNNTEFEPYIEELLENENYDCCKELIEEKKFDGNEHYCKDFEMVEIIETDSSMYELFGIGPNDEQNLTEAVNLSLKNRAVEDYREMLQHSDPENRLKAFETLSALASMNNKEAIKLLIESFKDIPAPVSLEAVHFKLEVFRFVNRDDYVQDLIPVLFRDLYETKSTNQTRQWISEIFRFLSIYKKEEKVTGNLEKMLTEKQFSYRIKKRIKDILEEDCY
ncbi:MAG: HEAT repeat domain-containing protein [Bacteroidales bacterium]|nr:HEAT repeat domain-containing protein [Bacteroidales bacterium]